MFRCLLRVFGSKYHFTYTTIRILYFIENVLVYFLVELKLNITCICNQRWIQLKLLENDYLIVFHEAEK